MTNPRPQFSAADESFMRRALALADRAKGSTFPNPAVGAVVVDAAGRVVGEGATGVCGGPSRREAGFEAGGGGGGRIHNVCHAGAVFALRADAALR